MQYRRLGRSELMVAEVGLGVRALAGWNARAASETVRAGLDAGMNVVELAAADAAAAAAVGEAIEGRRSQVLLMLTGDGDPDTLEQALARLGADHVDCYLLDYPPDVAGGGDEAWARLDALRERGLSRFPGIAARSPGAALEAVEGGRVEVVQMSYNFVDGAAAEAALAAASAADVGLLACSPLAGGRLATEQAGDGSGATAALATLNEGEPRTLAQAAIAWALSDRRVSAVVAGARTAGQATEDAEASRMAPLPEADLERAARLIGHDSELDQNNRS